MSTFNSIRTSAENKAIVTELTRKLNLGTENVIARIALSYSLSKGKSYKPTDVKDAKGKEYNKKVLFGDYSPYFIAMICTHYNIHKTDRDIPKLIKIHIDNGLELINNIIHKKSGADIFLLQELLKN